MASPGLLKSSRRGYLVGDTSTNRWEMILLSPCTVWLGFHMMTITEISCNRPEIIFSFRIMSCWVILKRGWRIKSFWFSSKNFLFLTVDGPYAYSLQNPLKTLFPPTLLLTQLGVLFRGRVECSFVVLFELVYVFGKDPYLASGTSLLSFSLFTGPLLKFHSVGTSLIRIFDLYFSKRWSFLSPDTCFT